jgi:hypothetical protein
MIGTIQLITRGYPTPDFIGGIIVGVLLLIMWYFICKYVIATGFGCRDDPTNTIFFAGIIFVLVVVILTNIIWSVLK